MLQASVLAMMTAINSVLVAVCAKAQQGVKHTTDARNSSDIEISETSLGDIYCMKHNLLSVQESNFGTRSRVHGDVAGKNLAHFSCALCAVQHGWGHQEILQLHCY